jgi:hypothetical protein
MKQELGGFGAERRVATGRAAALLFSTQRHGGTEGHGGECEVKGVKLILSLLYAQMPSVALRTSVPPC